MSLKVIDDVIIGFDNGNFYIKDSVNSKTIARIVEYIHPMSQEEFIEMVPENGKAKILDAMQDYREVAKKQYHLVMKMDEIYSNRVKDISCKFVIVDVKSIDDHYFTKNEHLVKEK